MSKTLIIPVIISVLQVVAIIYLLYINRFGNAHVPIAFIGLNILAVTSIGILIISYFQFFKTENQIAYWWVPITIASLTIVMLVIQYIRMWLGYL